MLKNNSSNKQLNTFLLGVVIFFYLLSLVALVYLDPEKAIEEGLLFKRLIEIVVLVVICIVHYFLGREDWYRNGLFFFAFAITLMMLSLIPPTASEFKGAKRVIEIGGLIVHVYPWIVLSLLLSGAQFFSQLSTNRAIFDITSLKIVAGFLLVIFLSMQQPHALLLMMSLLLLVGMGVFTAKRKTILMIILCLICFLILLIFSSPYLLQRLMLFTTPLYDSLSSNYQLNTSLMMFSGGGWFGTEASPPLTQLMFGGLHLHGAMMMSLMTENFGVFFSFISVIFSCAISTCLLILAMRYLRARKRFEGYFTMGMVIWFSMHWLGHIASNLGWIPTWNISFPFLSVNTGLNTTMLLGLSLVLTFKLDSEKNSLKSLLPTILCSAFFIIIIVWNMVAITNTDILHERYEQTLQNIKQRKLKKVQTLPTRLSKRENYRRTITDRYGTPLAFDQAAYDLEINPRKINLQDPNWSNALKILEISVDKLTEFRSHETYHYLKRHVTPYVAKAIEELNLRGVDIKQVLTREQPEGQIILPIIGLTDIDKNGISGVELSMNESLFSKSQDNGQALILSLDMPLQKQLFKTLSETFNQDQGSEVEMIVVDGETAEILSLINYPGDLPKHRNNDKFNDKNYLISRIITQRKAIAPFLNMTEGLNKKEQEKLITSLGFGRVLGTQLPEQVSGFSPDNYFRNTMATDQDKDIEYTLLQLAQAWTIMANGGKSRELSITLNNRDISTQLIVAPSLFSQWFGSLSVIPNSEQTFYSVQTEFKKLTNDVKFEFIQAGHVHVRGKTIILAIRIKSGSSTEDIKTLVNSLICDIFLSLSTELVGKG